MAGCFTVPSLKAENGFIPADFCFVARSFSTRLRVSPTPERRAFYGSRSAELCDNTLMNGAGISSCRNGQLALS